MVLHQISLLESSVADLSSMSVSAQPVRSHMDIFYTCSIPVALQSWYSETRRSQHVKIHLFGSEEMCDR